MLNPVQRARWRSACNHRKKKGMYVPTAEEYEAYLKGARLAGTSQAPRKEYVSDLENHDPGLQRTPAQVLAKFDRLGLGKRVVRGPEMWGK